MDYTLFVILAEEGILRLEQKHIFIIIDSLDDKNI